MPRFGVPHGHIATYGRGFKRSATAGRRPIASPVVAGTDKRRRSRDADASEFCQSHAQESPSNAPLERREAERRQAHPTGARMVADKAALSRNSSALCGARPSRSFLPRKRSRIKEGARSPLGAPPRWLGLRPRFLELPSANGRTLPGASAASTSQTGRTRRTGRCPSRPQRGPRILPARTAPAPSIGRHR